MTPELLADLIMLLARLEQPSAGPGQRLHATQLRVRYAAHLAAGDA